MRCKLAQPSIRTRISVQHNYNYAYHFTICLGRVFLARIGSGMGLFFNLFDVFLCVICPNAGWSDQHILQRLRNGSLSAGLVVRVVVPSNAPDLQLPNRVNRAESTRTEAV